MDKTTTASERETQDFMNVDSFSQLPFIRPAPPIKEKPGIRLFGIEFAGGDNSAVSADDSESAETTTNNNLTSFDLDPANKDDTTTATTITTADTSGESSRRFECHYCCRNFPTSQALGGHQNAHKRERQHAKRAHLQSTMVHGGTFSDAHHVYNLMNYRFGSAPTTPMPYPTWNNAANARFYGTATSFSHNHHQQQQQQQPINGSPLAFWRIPSGTSNNPSFSHERSLPPLFASEEITNVRASQVVGASGSQNRYVYDSKRGSVHDHVSLDLHL
ncbi:Zinc finger protein 8 [Spatholobus suberectus]|nr:Zinc finger protein 8 [Spatholobus suberectus]